MSNEKNKNNEKPEDLLPDWMVSLLKPGNRLCHKCEHDLALDDVFGIELFCTSPEDAVGNGPKAALDAYCSHCGVTLRFMLNVDLPDLLHAVEGFYAYLIKYRTDGEPPAPTLEPKPFKANPNRTEQVVAWDGDAAPPPRLDGTTLTVPVGRHDYRLLVIERK